MKTPSPGTSARAAGTCGEGQYGPRLDERRDAVERGLTSREAESIGPQGRRWCCAAWRHAEAAREA